MYEARFSKLYRSPRPCTVTPKLKAAHRPITQILILVLALEQHFWNYKQRMKKQMWPATGIHNTDPTSSDNWCRKTVKVKVKVLGCKLEKTTVNTASVSSFTKFLLHAVDSPKKNIYIFQRKQNVYVYERFDLTQQRKT